MKILITMPSLNDPGGVSGYFKIILPIIAKEPSSLAINILEIGSSYKRNFLFRVTDQIRFMKALWMERPDLVHINPSLNLNSFLRDGLFIFWAKLFNKNILVFFHGWQETFEKKIQGFYKFFFNNTFGKSDGFIVLARSFEKSLKDLGIKAPISTMTTVVDSAMIKENLMEYRKKTIKTHSPFRILFLSRLEREKGIIETINAVKLLLERKINIVLSIAGDGNDKMAVAEEISRLGLSNNIFMLGYLRGEDKMDLLLNHHIYCLPSYHEGMPLSILEAMAAGLPIVTRPVGGIKDFFEDSKMGCLSQTLDPYEIAACIEKILSDKEKMICMAEYNYRYAKFHFNADHVADQLMKVYHTHLNHMLDITSPKGLKPS